MSRRVRSKSQSRVSKLHTNRGLMPSIKEDEKEQATDED